MKLKKLSLLVGVLFLSQQALSYIPASGQADVDGYFPPPSTIYFGKGNLSNPLTWVYSESTSTSAPAPANWTQGLMGMQSVGGFVLGNPGAPDGPTPLDSLYQDARTLNVNQSTATLWATAKFNIPVSEQSKFSQMMLWARWDDSVDIYINGILAARGLEFVNSYRYMGISREARASLRAGQENTIAIRLNNTTSGPGYFDLAIVEAPKMVDLPATGVVTSSNLHAVTDLARDLMSQYGVSAGTLSISRQKGGENSTDIKTLYTAGFGYARKELTTPVKEDAILRLASVDKPISRVALATITENVDFLTQDTTVKFECVSSKPSKLPAVTNPVTGSRLKCDDLVVDLIAKLPADGGTAITDAEAAAFKETYPRMASLTIGQLLNFQGGFADRTDSQPPSTFYASTAPISSTDGPKNLIRYYFRTEPKQCSGGWSTTCNSNYNNDDPAIARYIVDKLLKNSGQYGGSLEAFIQSSLNKNIPSEISIAHDELNGRDAREPWYNTFQAPTSFTVGLDHALALKATAKSLSQSSLRDTPRTYPATYGGMRGTGAVSRSFSIDSIGNLVDPFGEPPTTPQYTINVSWIVNASVQMFGNNNESAEWKLIRLLKSLPISTWEEDTASSALFSGKLISLSNGFCVGGTTSLESPVQANACSNTASAKTFEISPAGSLCIKGSNTCIHPLGGWYIPTDGTSAVYYDGKSDPWTDPSQDRPNITYTFTSDGHVKHNTSNSCLTLINNSQLVFKPCDYSDNNTQRFAFIRSSVGPLNTQLPLCNVSNSLKKCAFGVAGLNLEFTSAHKICQVSSTNCVVKQSTKAVFGTGADTFSMLPGGQLMHDASGTCLESNIDGSFDFKQCNFASLNQALAAPAKRGPIMNVGSSKCISDPGSNPQNSVVATLTDTCSLPLELTKGNSLCVQGSNYCLGVDTAISNNVLFVPDANEPWNKNAHADMAFTLEPNGQIKHTSSTKCLEQSGTNLILANCDSAKTTLANSSQKFRQAAVGKSGKLNATILANTANINTTNNTGCKRTSASGNSPSCSLVTQSSSSYVDLNENTGYLWRYDLPTNNNSPQNPTGIREAELYVKVGVNQGTRKMDVYVNSAQVGTLVATSNEAPRGVGKEFGPFKISLKSGVNTVELRDFRVAPVADDEFDVYQIHLLGM